MMIIGKMMMKMMKMMMMMMIMIMIYSDMDEDFFYLECTERCSENQQTLNGQFIRGVVYRTTWITVLQLFLKKKRINKKTYKNHTYIHGCVLV